MFGQYYSVLHSTTQYYSVLPSATPYYEVLTSTIPHYTVLLQTTTPYYKALLRTTKYYTILLRTTQRYSVLQSATPYYKVLHTQYYFVLHSTTKYCYSAPGSAGSAGPRGLAGSTGPRGLPRAHPTGPIPARARGPGPLEDPTLQTEPQSHAKESAVLQLVKDTCSCKTEECEGYSCHQTNLSNPDPVQHSILETIYEKLWGISGLKAFHPSHSENAFRSASWLVRLTSIIQISKQDHA